jgi:hypothetical protein
LSNGDGGRSSHRRRPDGGPWRWLFVVVVMVGPFLVSVMVVVVYFVVVAAAVANKSLK